MSRHQSTIGPRGQRPVGPSRGESPPHENPANRQKAKGGNSSKQTPAEAPLRHVRFGVGSGNRRRSLEFMLKRLFLNVLGLRFFTKLIERGFDTGIDDLARLHDGLALLIAVRRPKSI